MNIYIKFHSSIFYAVERLTVISTPSSARMRAAYTIASSLVFVFSDIFKVEQMDEVAVDRFVCASNDLTPQEIHYA